MPQWHAIDVEPIMSLLNFIHYAPKHPTELPFIKDSTVGSLLLFFALNFLFVLMRYRSIRSFSLLDHFRIELEKGLQAYLIYWHPAAGMQNWHHIAAARERDLNLWCIHSNCMKILFSEASFSHNIEKLRYLLNHSSFAIRC